MEIDSTVSKQTTILIDLHFPFFFFFFFPDALIPLCPASLLITPLCVSLRMCLPSLRDNGFLTTPIPGFNVA